LNLPSHMNDGETIASYLSHVPKHQKDPEKQALLESLLEAVKSAIPKKCYRCDKSNFKTKEKYIRHCITRHPGLPAYPGPADILAEKLQPQNMLWEK
jgi:hypothetical protein